MKRIYIYINGILNLPGASDNWTDCAVTYTITNFWRKMYFAEKFEYFSAVVTRRLRQQDRAERLARMIRYFDYDWDLVLVGHSNGCDVIMRTLEILGTTRPIKQIHFIAPAVERSAIYTINMMLRSPQLDDFRIYTGGKDGVLKAATWSKRLLAPFGLGYGDLGAMPEKELSDIIGAHRVIHEPEFGHSTWWDKKDYFDETMRRIIHLSKEV